MNEIGLNTSFEQILLRGFYIFKSMRQSSCTAIYYTNLYKFRYKKLKAIFKSVS